MTARYDLLITSMREAAHTVMIIFGVAIGILVSRWSIKFIPASYRTWVSNGFDLWLVFVNLVLFIVSN